jgi:hypothetical protein
MDVARTNAYASETADRSWLTWTLIGLAGIWGSVLVISVAAPDLVSGSEHEHLPLAAFTTWIWGLIATVGLLWGMSKLRGSAARERTWIGLAVATLVVWAIAVVLAVSLPPYVTGSDPTELPLWALLVPLAASMLTLLASVVAGLFSEAPGQPSAGR